MFKIPTLIFIGVLLLYFNNALAQAGKISGIVKDKSTKAPVLGVNIAIVGTQYGGSTNNEGLFEIDSVPLGKHLLKFSHLSYFGVDTFQIINSNTENKLMVMMIQKTTGNILPLIEIQDNYSLPFVMGKYYLPKIDFSGSMIRDAGDYLRTVPNIGGVRKGGSAIDPVVRGFRFSQLNVRVDGGIRIEGGCPNRMDPTTAHIDNDDIEIIEIINGPYALKYGVSFGGYINLQTTKPTPFKTSKFELQGKSITGYESNWNGYKQFFQLKGGNNKVFFNLSTGQKKYGNYSDGNGNEVHSQINKQSYTAEVGFKIKKKHNFIFSYKGHHGGVNAFPSLPMDEISDNTHVIYAEYTGMKISEKIMGIKVRIFNTNVDHLMDNTLKSESDTVKAASKVGANVWGGAAGTTIKAGKKGLLFMGMGYETTSKVGNRLKYMIDQIPDTYQIPYKSETLMNATISNYGFVTEYSANFNKFNLVSALRFDYNIGESEELIAEDFNGDIAYQNDDVNSAYPNLSFSAGITKKLGKNIMVGFSLGRGVRSPDMIERYIRLLPIGFDNFDYLGNPQVKPEQNNQIDISFSFKTKNIGSFHLNGFYSYITNYITARVLPPTMILPNSSYVVGVKQFYNTDAALFRGFEFLYNLPAFHNFQAQIMAGYTYATNPNASGYFQNSDGLPAGEIIIENDPISEIPPFETQLLISHKSFNNRLTSRISARFVAPQNYVSKALNEYSTPGFSLVNMSILYKLNSHFSTTAGVNNLFNLAYYEHLNRRIIGSTTNIYEPGRSFFINFIINI